MTSSSKSKSAVFSPGGMSGGAFRRLENEGNNEVFGRHGNLRTMRDRLEGGAVNGHAEWGSVALGEIFAELPYPVSSSLKVLGVTFNMGLDSRHQLESILDKAQVRLAVLARVAGATWGLEMGMLRLTHNSLLVSLIRYGLIIMGSGLFERHFLKMESRITNIAARRITGVGRSARPMVLHFVAGVSSAHNMFVPDCAYSVDRELRAEGSTVRTWMVERTAGIFGRKDWNKGQAELEDTPGVRPIRGRQGICEEGIRENWFFTILDVPPGPFALPKTKSTFHTSAMEIGGVPVHKSKIFHFEGVRDWVEVGMQILKTIDWGGDVALPQSENVEMRGPPQDAKNGIIIRSRKRMWWQASGEGTGRCVEGQNNRKGKEFDVEDLRWEELWVVVGVFFQQHMGASCSWMKDPSGEISTQGWLHGVARPGAPFPACLEMLGLLHALILVHQYLREDENEKPKRIGILASNPRLTDAMLRRFNTGSFGPKKEGSSEVIRIFTHWMKFYHAKWRYRT